MIRRWAATTETGITTLDVTGPLDHHRRPKLGSKFLERPLKRAVPASTIRLRGVLLTLLLSFKLLTLAKRGDFTAGFPRWFLNLRFCPPTALASLGEIGARRFLPAV